MKEETKNTVLEDLEKALSKLPEKDPVRKKLEAVLESEKQEPRLTDRCFWCNSKPVNKGYCRYHYYRARERGMGNDQPCREENCELFAVSRGMCFKHYQRSLRRGEVKVGFGECRVCEGQATARDGYCKKHRPEKKCTEEGCERPQKSRGLCGTHYQADRRKKLRGT